MKIGVVCYPKFGGSGVVATELGLAMARKGHEVHFISYDTPARLTGCVRNVHYHQVPVPSYPLFKYPPYALALATRIMEVVRDHGLDLLHAHYALPHTISATLARQMLMSEAPDRTSSFKIITTLHGTDTFLVGREPSYAPVTRYAIQVSDGVTAVSEFLEAYTRKEFDVTVPIRVLPNFVDTERFSGDPGSTQRSDFCDDGEKIITHISNFRPIKRVCDIIKMFAQVSKATPARLLMVGEGPDLSAADRLAHSLGVADRVRFLGRQERVEQILAISDLTVMASETESFGLAALEAMSCAVPVIGTRVGGFVEVVEHGVTGLLCDVGQPDQLADAAIRLLTQPEMHEQFSAAGRERAVTQFPVEKITAAYEDYYMEILNSDA